LCVAGASVGFPCNDPIFFPLYEASMTYRRPILVTVGYTGRGGGLPGGNGIRLELCHPRYIDDLAARFPELQVIAGRPAWPWQDEMIAVLLHKANVWNELHGWRPKHFTDALKREIPRRLSDKIMFGADYPLLKYDQLVSDWLDLGYDEATIDKSSAGTRRRCSASRGIDMDTGLSGKVAIVGGASQGIGFAIARLLALEGAKVAMVARKEERLQEAVAQIGAECEHRPIAIRPTSQGGGLRTHRQVRRRAARARCTCSSTTTARRRSPTSSSATTPRGTRRSSRIS
jgi:hypothetical protein